MKLLICDKIHPKALELLTQNHIAFDYLPEITPDQLKSSISNYEGLLVRSRTKVTKDIIDAGANVKIIGRVGSGVDNIDISAANKKGITVVNAPGANAPAVAEHTLTLILNLLHPIPQAIASMGQGKWLKNDLKGEELGGKTIGIVGYGNIGKRVVRLVNAFGVKVLVYSRTFKTAELEDLFCRSDIVTIHLALTDQTRGMISISLLNRLKPTAYFINASRGEVVDEEGLFEVLSQKKIAGAALDVFWKEPLEADSKWRKLSNVILTPHIGASTKEAFERASVEVANKIIEFVFK
jgi:D-3-phosphoglycerate dehydrogenase